MDPDRSPAGHLLRSESLAIWPGPHWAAARADHAGFAAGTKASGRAHELHAYESCPQKFLFLHFVEVRPLASHSLKPPVTLETVYPAGMSSLQATSERTPERQPCA